MAILIANIGTSSPLVLIDEHYFPIGFDRNEKNLDIITDEERQIWENKDNTIALKLCPELGIEPKQTFRNKDGEITGYKFDFRKLTRRIWEEYQKNSSYWKNRLAPGRIGGVIEEAQSRFKVQKAYIFVTDQSTKENPDYHDGDTCYLFEILNKIIGDKINLIPIYVKDNAINADSLLETYYNFFKTHISNNETVLVNIKGGTPQMQTALKMQAIASSIPNLLFIDPQLNRSKILKGENSECSIASYWRYLKTQKYQSVRLLLNSRWDFHGSKVILEEWQNTLDFLQDYLSKEDKLQLKQEQQKLNSVSSLLKEAADHLNFVSARKLNDPLHSLLNLYAQCKIYWELEEIANVLPRLGSFYEESLQVIIRYISQEKWFKNNNRNENWILLKHKLDLSLKEEYEKVEESFDKPIRWSTDRQTKKKISTLGSRYRKRNFAEALVNRLGTDAQKDNWKAIIKDLKQIDFWVDKRNDLIHGTKGLTLETMEQEYENYKNSYTAADEEKPYKPSIPCHYKNILGHITSVCEQVIKLVEQEANSCVGYGDSIPNYLYSDLKDAVIKQLDE